MMWMTARRFDWMLRTRGPELATWPAPDHQAALRLLRRSRTAQRLLADALVAEDEPLPDPAALSRMQGAVRRALAPPPAVLRGMRWGAIAACAAAGLYLGLVPTDPELAPWASTLQATSPATVLAALDE